MEVNVVGKKQSHKKYCKIKINGDFEEMVSCTNLAIPHNSSYDYVGIYVEQTLAPFPVIECPSPYRVTILGWHILGEVEQEPCTSSR